MLAVRVTQLRNVKATEIVSKLRVKTLFACIFFFKYLLCVFAAFCTRVLIETHRRDLTCQRDCSRVIKLLTRISARETETAVKCN